MSPSEYQELVEFLGHRFGTIDRQFEAVNHQFDAVTHQFEAVHRQFEAVDRQFGELRSDLAGLRAEMLGHFDELYRRLERLEQEYQAITHALRRIEALMADEQGRREVLERDLATLRENVAVLKARIDEVERRLRS